MKALRPHGSSAFSELIAASRLLADFRLKDPSCDFPLRDDRVDLVPRLSEPTCPYQVLQPRTFVGQRESAQGRARALQCVRGGENCRLVFLGSRVSESGQCDRHTIEERLDDLPEGLWIGQVLA